MSDLKLFRLTGGKVTEIQGAAVALEKSLQTLIERHLDAFLGVRFLASEFPAGNGRMDTLGIDENGFPVIVEYKRATNENVINQGLFYLDWLLDHKADFELLVLKALGKESADEIDWSAPRLLCIAGDFTKYDEHAVKQMNHNIELIRYKRYDDDLLLFELVNATAAAQTQTGGGESAGRRSRGRTATVSDYLERAPIDLKDLYERLKSELQAFGDDVPIKTLKNYFAFKRIKNFACVQVHNQNRNLLVFVKIDPTSITLDESFTRDVSNLGHFGTGDLEITIRDERDLERTLPLIRQSYEAS